MQNGAVVYFVYLIAFGTIMTLLRMSTAAVLERSGYTPEDRVEYLFTQSQWGAISYISRRGGESHTVVEGEYVDPWAKFPARIMKSVDYALKFGVQAHVTEYEFVDCIAAGSIAAGAIIELFDGPKEDRKPLGFYAVRYRD